MLLGFVGAHRTGKSTICQYLADNGVAEYVKFPTAETLRRLDVDINEIDNIQQRVYVQTEILKDYKNFICEYTNKSKVFVTDRTPIDIAAYMYADIGSLYLKNYSDEVESELNLFFGECADLTVKNFDGLLFTRPYGGYEIEDGKPLASMIYQKHIDMNINSIIMDNNIFNCWEIKSGKDIKIKMETARYQVECIIEYINNQ